MKIVKRKWREKIDEPPNPFQRSENKSDQSKEKKVRSLSHFFYEKDYNGGSKSSGFKHNSLAICLQIKKKGKCKQMLASEYYVESQELFLSFTGRLIILFHNVGSQEKEVIANMKEKMRCRCEGKDSFGRVQPFLFILVPTSLRKRKGIWGTRINEEKCFHRP